ncbi:MAG: hypothetical protein QM729_05075 [Solirubrobacterales bacterium]
MRTAAVFTVAAVLSLPALLAGCGGGGDSGNAEFATAAEAACTSARGQIAALGTPEPDTLVKYLQSTDSIVARMRAKLGRIKGQGTAEKAYAEGLAIASKALGEMVLAAQGQNFDSVGEISERLAKVRLGELAEEAGLESCAKVLKVKS